MSEPAKDEAELLERIAKAFCCPSPSGCVGNINCDRLDFQIDAIRALAAIRAAGWDVVPQAELEILRAENTRLREALEETCNALEAATAFHYAKGGFPFKSSKQTLKQARAALAGEVKP